MRLLGTSSPPDRPGIPRNKTKKHEMAQILRRPTWGFKLSLESLIKLLVSPFLQSLWGMHPPGHSNEQRDETILVSSGKQFFPS